MALTYLKIFADMEETLSLYSDEERGRLLSAMMAYSFRGEEPEFTGAERFVWPMLRKHIDSCEVQNEKLKANGKRGGRPETKAEANETKENQTITKDNQEKANETKADEIESKKKPIQEQEQEQDHEQEHDHKSTKGKRTRFVAPTIAECENFFVSSGGSYVQATRFHNYYEANGWRVGKNPMKDWKAAARGWISRDKEGGFGNSGGGSVRSAPPQEKMLRYTPEQRKENYSAAVLDFDEV